MELVLVRLAGPETANRMNVTPDHIKDILWAHADPADKPEHIKVNAGRERNTVDVVIFLLAEKAEAGPIGLRICVTAIENAPMLANWTAALLPGPTGPPDVWGVVG